MSIKLADRLSAVKPSPTLAITARAAEMRAAGKDIIGLGAGEPDFDTPVHIKTAAIEAINNGFTKYTAVDGTPSLKQAVIDKFNKDNGFKYNARQILVSSGGKQSFYNLAQALLNEGDEVSVGQAIAKTGVSGLALGDHLHFGLLVQGIEVRPVEWFDQSWIRKNVDNIFKAADKIIEGT